MQHWLDKLVDLAALRGDEDTLNQGLANLARQAGFFAYAYLHLRPGHTVTSSNYPTEWRTVYLKRNFEAIDPIISRAKSAKGVFSWSGDVERRHLSKDVRSFFDQASDHGIRSGVTIPIKAANGAVSVFTLASDKFSTDLQCVIDPIMAAAAVAQLHVRLSLLPLAPIAQHPAWLDPKEAAYLNWISVGKTMEEVAVLEGVTYNSVKSKLEAARRRLNVHTMPHLIALAIRTGLI